MTTLTPEQCIQKRIVEIYKEQADDNNLPEITDESWQEIWDDLSDDSELGDATEELRSSGIETGIESEWSRHYESKSVAAMMTDGTWIGWTYWFGGGKHGEPEAIDWMDSAYFLDCREELRPVKIFTKRD